jgi:pimeloyl-ACP methyl ester carboxylesterase
MVFVGLRLAELFAPAWVGAAALRLFTRPRHYPRPAHECAVLAEAERLTIPMPKGKLPAWRWGEGPVVLLVHGWEGRGSQLAPFVQPLVDAGYCVVSFDAPGHGDAPGRTANLLSFAHAIAAVVAAIGPVHGVVAHSMGGAASLYALRSGLGVQRAVFVAPANAGKAIERFCAFAGLSPGTARRMEALLEERFGVPLEHFSGPRLAADLDVSALVIHDDRDRYVPWGDGAAIAEAWSGSALHTTSGLGHHRILRDPEVVERAVAFLRA